jgi:hypothetical protein
MLRNSSLVGRGLSLGYWLGNLQRLALLEGLFEDRSSNLSLPAARSKGYEGIVNRFLWRLPTDTAHKLRANHIFKRYREFLGPYLKVETCMGKG